MLHHHIIHLICYLNRSTCTYSTSYIFVFIIHVMSVDNMLSCIHVHVFVVHICIFNNVLFTCRVSALPSDVISKLRTKAASSNERLCQKPLDSFSENSPVWYCNSGVREKTLSSFMSRLSKSCGLSLIFTNHSIRANGATILSKS